MKHLGVPYCEDRAVLSARLGAYADKQLDPRVEVKVDKRNEIDFVCTVDRGVAVLAQIHDSVRTVAEWKACVEYANNWVKENA